MKRSTNSMTKHAGLCAFALLMLPLAANAAVAGKFQFVAGSVAVTDAQGKSHPAQKGTDINEGETLVTDASGSAQIRMVDGGIIALRPDTRMTVSTYAYNGKEDGTESAVFTLVKGGLRAITGAIGKVHKENYKIKTANATIGIRGTDHEAIVVLPGQPGTAGTYDKVNVGATTLRTDAGVALIGPNQVGFAASATQPPVLLPKLPDIFRAAPAPQAHQTQSTTATQENSASTNSSASPTASSSSTDTAATSSVAASTSTANNLTGVNSSGTSLNTLNQTLTTSTGATAAIGAGTVRAVGVVNNWRTNDYLMTATGPSDPNVFKGAVDGGVQAPNQVLEDASGLTGFSGKVFGVKPLDPTMTILDNSPAAIRIGTAVNQDTGSTTLSGVPVTWGRWVGGAVDIYTVDGTQKIATVDNTNRSVHWISIGAVSSSFLQLPLTGTATYNFIGGTAPTDLRGNVGSLGPVTLNADFANQRASTTINASFNSPGNTSNWSMTANNIPFATVVDDGFKSTTAQNGVNGITHTVSCTGPSCGPQNIGFVDGHFVMNAQGAVVFYGMSTGSTATLAPPPGGTAGTQPAPTQPAFTPVNTITGLAVFKK